MIKIKKEEDIQRRLGIKSEPSDVVDEQKEKKCSVSKSQVETIMEEKNNLIATIISLKLENQQLCYKLNERDTELDSTKSLIEQKERSIRELKANIVSISSDLKCAETKAARLEMEFMEKHQNDQKVIAGLNTEKKLLTARIKQLQTGVNSTKESDDENVYEVERIIADKREGNSTYYRVRWLGYGPKHDTWQKAEDLFCPTILKEYLESKSKQN